MGELGNAILKLPLKKAKKAGDGATAKKTGDGASAQNGGEVATEKKKEKIADPSEVIQLKKWMVTMRNAFSSECAKGKRVGEGKALDEVKDEDEAEEEEE